MWQSVKTLTVFNTLTLKQIFWKTKTFLKKLEYAFLVESTKIGNKSFHTKLPFQKPILKQIEWWVQNGPITKSGVLSVTTLFFWKLCFSLKTSYKELIWCINNPNTHIRTFYKRWSFIWRYFFLVSILNFKYETNTPFSLPIFITIIWPSKIMPFAKLCEANHMEYLIFSNLF